MQRWKGLGVAIAYGIISISITFFNKAVFKLYNFNASNTVTLGQMIFSLIFLWTMKQSKVLEYEDFKWKTAKTLFPLAISFAGMAITGLAALKFIGVAIYSTLRRLTTFIVIVAQFFTLNKTVPQDELNSVIFMVTGAIIAGWGDLEFDLWGYFLTFVNCVVTAWYLILIAKKSTETGIKTFGLMFYNNLLTMPIVVIIVLLTEWDVLVNFDHWFDLGFQFCFLMSSIQAFLLNYTVFLCSTINSPLTTSITGQLKSILSTLFGLFAFGGTPLTTPLLIGLIASTVGGLWYGQIKYVQQVQSHQKTGSDEEKSNSK